MRMEARSNLCAVAGDEARPRWGGRRGQGRGGLCQMLGARVRMGARLNLRQERRTGKGEPGRERARAMVRKASPPPCR